MIPGLRLYLEVSDLCPAFDCSQSNTLLRLWGIILGMKP